MQPYQICELITAIFSSVGIQVGGVGSSYGVLGSWTTVFHEDEDPVGKRHVVFFPAEGLKSRVTEGPFWMHKV